MRNYTHILLAFLAFSCFQIANAQDRGINYQAIIINPSNVELPGNDASGIPYANQLVCMEFALSNGYQETHQVETDAYGLVSLTIGHGDSSDDFSTLVWNGNAVNLTVKISYDNCFSFSMYHSQELLAVPFALHASNVNWADIANMPPGLDTIAADLAAVQADVDANETASDAADATHTTNIATNATAIAANTATGATNATNIAANTSANTATQADVDANETASDAADATHTTNIATNATAIAANTATGATNATNIAANTSANTATQADVNQNESDSDSADATHTTNIATNAATGVTNATAISGNTSANTATQADVDANETASDAADATHTTNIATNATAIAANTATGATNATNIAANTSANTATQADVDANETASDAADATHTTNIATNATAIAANTATGATNATNIAANTSANTATQADVDANELASDAADATHTTNIATNTATGATNATNIASNDTDIATNATNITSNDTDIATNATNIGTNTATGVTNATAIAAINTLANGKIYLGNGSNQVIEVTLSGDVTIDNAGVSTIGANKVVTGKIADANVTTAKIADGNVTEAKLSFNVATQTELDATNVLVAANTAKNSEATGTATGQMKYWNGAAWITVAPPATSGSMLVYDAALNAPVWGVSNATITLPPVADFSLSNTTAYTGTAVSFTDSTINTPTSWSWDFGDSNTSTSQNPSHTYAAEGDYTVSLTVTNTAGSNEKLKTVYITAASPPVVGDFMQGGVVFYIFQSGDTGYVSGETHGLVCAVSNQVSGMQWRNGSYTTTGATGTAIGTGATNTAAIVSNQGFGSYAAQLCNDLTLNGYSDWFLPSMDELNKMYTNKSAINTTAGNNSGSSFSNGYYWSSTEYTNYFAWTQFFLTGNRNPSYKYSTINVRAVRAF